MNASQLGTFAACLANDVRPSEFETVKGAAQALTSGPNAEAFGRQIAGLAYDIYVKSGSVNSFEAQLYGQLSKTANWQDFHYELLTPVYAAISKFHDTQKAAAQASEVNDSLEKQGTALLKTLGAGIAKVPQLLMASPQFLVGGATLGGAGLGALHWMLNRDATGADADSAAIESKIDYYNALRNEISDELRRNPPKELREAMRNKLKQAEEPGYAL